MSKKIIMTAMLACCLFGGAAMAQDAAPAKAEAPAAVAEALPTAKESRDLYLVVREGTSIEVDGKTLYGPSEVRGTTWFYKGKLDLGRHEVKLAHPKAGNWEGSLLVTKEYPAKNGVWNLADKLDYTHVHEDGEKVHRLSERWLEPLTMEISEETAAVFQEPREDAEKVAELPKGTKVTAFGCGSESGEELSIRDEKLTVTLEDGTTHELTKKDRFTLVDRSGSLAACEMDIQGENHLFVVSETAIDFAHPWYHVEGTIQESPFAGWIKAADVKLPEEK